jgi:arsenate reductase
MREADIDISHKQTQKVFDVFKCGQLFAYVIIVCDAASAEPCPIFPGYAKKLLWPFPDPSALTGSEQEKMRQVREIRKKVEEWCEDVCPAAFAPTSGASVMEAAPSRAVGQP